MEKLGYLYDKAGFSRLFAPRDLVAIKLHFGEKGSTAFVRPLFLRKLVEKVRESGAKPFLTDTNTLYLGSRSNAVDHTVCALTNGFAYPVVEAPVLIADGLKGKDQVKIETNLKHFREIYIGSLIYQADKLLVVSHFKGHGVTGFGGALKNVGMGCSSRLGKLHMHSKVKPAVTRKKCQACGECMKWCPSQAITLVEGRAQIDPEKCIGCGQCIINCSYGAIKINWNESSRNVQEKIVEYCYGLLKLRNLPAAYISFLTDISPNCDCCGYNDQAVVPDIGVLASFDPIAIDQAAVDLVNKATGVAGSALKENFAPGRDKFRDLFPQIDWNIQLDYGEELGLGTRKYCLIKVEMN